MKKILFSCILISSLSSCKIFYRISLGLDSTPSWYTVEQTQKLAKKRKIPIDRNLEMDTVSYANAVTSFYQNRWDSLKQTDIDSNEIRLFKRIWKDDVQPVRFHLYTADGTEIFKVVNCYVDPLFPMNWNIDGCLDQFPPRTNIESLQTHNFDLEFMLSHTHGVDTPDLRLENLPKADYYGVIVWNRFMVKPSRKLIKQIQEYVEHQDESIELIYIFNQKEFLWPYLDEENKKEALTL